MTVNFGELLFFALNFIA